MRHQFRIKKNLSLILAFLLLMTAAGCSSDSGRPGQEASAYADSSNWVYMETDATGKDADVFFINPTVYRGDETDLSWSTYDDETKAAFAGSINMEKGIYDDNARFFAPYYHQAALSAYYADEAEAAEAFDTAYRDIRDAFLYYLDHFNQGRPLVLAGFSQGGQLCIRLMKEFSGNETFDNVLVAAYAIGWRFTEEEQEAYPQIRFAQGETDTGVLISFNSEDISIHDSLLIPENTKTLAINPLNWKTDATPADRSLNLGACFTDYDGNIQSEIGQFSGAYIDDRRGALKMTDISPEDYPAVLFDEGVYHIYDYQFFYRNLEKNVQDRIAAFLAA